MKKEIIATIIFITIGMIISTWLVINQGRYIQQQAQEIRDLQARVKDLKFYAAQLEGEIEKARSFSEEGIASWYGREMGKITANGEIYNPDGITAAHKSLPFGSCVSVTNLENHKSIIVRINDRGPYIPGRIIDLSEGAARLLEYHHQGLARVLVETVEG